MQFTCLKTSSDCQMETGHGARVGRASRWGCRVAGAGDRPPGTAVEGGEGRHSGVKTVRPGGELAVGGEGQGRVSGDPWFPAGAEWGQGSGRFKIIAGAQKGRMFVW